MNDSTALGPAIREEPRISDAVLGMMIFVFTEVMFFAGLISAHTITRAGAPMGWPPPDQPRLPIEATAIDTVILLTSGFFALRAGQVFARERREATIPLSLAIGLGAFFVFAQGAEWFDLLREGFTLWSTQYGSFFYLIVGLHALHAIVAIVALAASLVLLRQDRLRSSTFGAVRLFWLFVVAIWPVLYLKVYL